MNKMIVRVLLIEDTPAEARMIELVLADAGSVCFQLASVGRLAEGLECLRAGGLDVVLLDLSLPDSFGIETFRRVYQHAPDVPILVLSGSDDAELAYQAVQMCRTVTGWRLSWRWMWPARLLARGPCRRPAVWQRLG